MNELTPSFECETGQVILEGLPAGAAGRLLWSLCRVWTWPSTVPMAVCAGR